MWTCSKCKAEIEDQFDTCWRCAEPSGESVRVDESPPHQIRSRSSIGNGGFPSMCHQLRPIVWLRPSGSTEYQESILVGYLHWSSFRHTGSGRVQWTSLAESCSHDSWDHLWLDLPCRSQLSSAQGHEMILPRADQLMGQVIEQARPSSAWRAAASRDRNELRAGAHHDLAKAPQMNHTVESG